MPPKRRLQPNAVLPASLASRIADEEATSERRYTKRTKNTAAARKVARKQAREEKKQRKNASYKRAHGFAQTPAHAHGQNKGKDQKAKQHSGSGSSTTTTTKAAVQKSKVQAKPHSQADDRARLVKFAKRNEGMYTLLRESNLIGDVDKEAGISSSANADEDLEDRELRRLERHLGIKTNTKLASAFHDEGLGDLLSGIEYGSSNVRKSSKDNKDDAEADRMSVDEEDSDAELGNSEEMAVSHDDDHDGSDDDEGDDTFGLDGFAGGEEFSSESEDSDVAEMYRSKGIDVNPDLSASESEEEDSDSDGEDVSDVESDVQSNIDDDSVEESALPTAAEVTVPAAGAGRYIPPSLRKKQAPEAEDERTAAIRKALQGQLNRLSESNIEGILLQIENQYQKYPRHYVTEVLTSLILQAIRSRIHMLDTILYVNAAVVGAVYRAVGLEPVAHLVQTLMEEFEQRFADGLAESRRKRDHEIADDGEGELAIGKECQNLCAFIAELYNFQVISCQLVYDVIRLCVKDINEFTAELLLKLIRISGQQLRKDDPSALKEVVRQVTETVGTNGVQKLSVRCRFMVESLTKLKDNRMRSAMTHSADNVERLKRFLGNMDKRRAVGAAEPINIGLQDIRDVGTKGKWWLVGASWVGRQYVDGEAAANTAKVGQAADASGDNTEMERLLSMAKEQHMNTDIRRAIFVALVGSEDYTDAFEQLLRLDLKKTQAREVMRVVLHCCGQEKAYNPFYTLVAQKLCAHHSTYRLTMQYALWDLLRELGETDVGGLGRIGRDDADAGSNVPLRRVVNLAKMYAWLIDKQALSLLVLKTVTFAKVETQARVFFQVMFSTLFLLHCKRTEKDAQAVYAVFQRAAANPTMCHGILFFFHHFVKHCDLVAEDERPVMRWGCKIAKEAIRNSTTSIAYEENDL
ncbi:suppressor of glycerol defect [Coemansia guatemalensis]|uniref:Suppressor of glycerol defect n=1 Tax=Coemansia guatemalensis TaxID=2761395 RepID=A0A9W8HWQ5_9FUNG|nr:suppressor of glycerol defect [Coemansia guatemalensis]